MKQAIITLLVIVAGIAVFFIIQNFSKSVEVVNEQDTAEIIETDNPETPDTDVSEVTEEETSQDLSKTIVGTSVDGNDITAYHYGTGDTELLFVGGIHGGYSWNTVLVAYELMDYLDANPTAIPENITVTVIPVLNPDGLNSVVGTTGLFAKTDVPTSEAQTVPGRFNANDVDLNRNFDCDWKAQGTWQKRTVSGGTEAFSEPESQAIQTYVTQNNISAAVVWYSAVGGVFASTCHNGILPETLEITNAYSKASGYKAYEEFDFYEITGDMVNWLAKNKIPAISVLLSTHTDVEWDKNEAGVKALLDYYSN